MDTSISTELTREFAQVDNFTKILQILELNGEGHICLFEHKIA